MPAASAGRMRPGYTGAGYDDPMNDDLAIPVTDADHALGPASAPLTLVEYGDYECPGCLNAEPIVSALRDQLGDRLRTVFRHYPQSGVHARASAAAEAAEAAAAQGRFWDMHRELFRHSQTLAEVDLTHLALKLGLDVYQFQQATAAGTYAPRVRADHDGGTASGVEGTPTFFVNGKRYRGRATVDGLVAAINEATLTRFSGTGIPAGHDRRYSATRTRAATPVVKRRSPRQYG